MGYGGINGNGAPINSIGDIGSYLTDHGYKLLKDRRGDYVMDTQASSHDILHHDLEDRRIEKIFKEISSKIFPTQHDDKPLRHRRYVFIIDRRNPSEYLHPSEQEEKEKVQLNNNKREDRIYCIVPRDEEYATVDKEYGQFPETFFEKSKGFLLPTKNKNDKIGMGTRLNGYMFNLSYHLMNEDAIKCYWSHCGEMQRFFGGTDIEQFWPKLFVDRPNGKKQGIDEKSLSEVYVETNDDSFEQFYASSTSFQLQANDDEKYNAD